MLIHVIVFSISVRVGALLERDAEILRHKSQQVCPVVINIFLQDRRAHVKLKHCLGAEIEILKHRHIMEDRINVPIAFSIVGHMLLRLHLFDYAAIF